MPGPVTSSKKPLWIIIAGFSIVLIANGFLVYYALNTWTGLETEQHYAKGLAYNNNLDAAKRQQALEWHDEMEIEFTGSSIPVTGLAHVKFSDKAGNPLTDLTVKILATRPTHDGFDQEFFVLHEGNGRYRVPFSLPLKGQWEFRILARRGKDDYQRVERIVTP
ncbi:MAG: FixH family protein [Rhodospirillaceae bacterium]|nr:FixH family protein [Rhodospirillaceae bacterium]MBT5242778.1 FixH family protein [Rhodospirillaceae bacterium]MBT5562749.1 FixH family protein [Rhodospirillaceae bacterium]MBT6243254.1 FixH family protein [Rhodospirillaceae bacterium]